ncbi:hypothetical protein [uncultured Roseobacter sp.]|uniref:hypothetical protein n=1 Tax=uncultured Roseobacter sp. TaxID=114847 RepID=UPI002623A741|nr:hypothetical protein [uncultured Roseobacter sp.]
MVQHNHVAIFAVDADDTLYTDRYVVFNAILDPKLLRVEVGAIGIGSINIHEVVKAAMSNDRKCRSMANILFAGEPTVSHWKVLQLVAGVADKY